jgi:hypothetical protein
METTLSIIKNPETGKNELLTEYLFCDDLWREIKSFMLLPYTLHKGLARLMNIIDKVTENDVLSYARKHLDIRGAKRLCRMMDKHRRIFDKNGNCIVDGLNVELYNQFKREAKIEKVKNNKIYRQEIIDEYRPYHCATGGYFLYDGTWMEPHAFSWRFTEWDRTKTRQQKIDMLNKKHFSGLISAGLFKYFSIKHQREYARI